MLEWIKEFIRAWRDYPIQPGRRIAGRYEVIEWLGMGSYGLSYRCIERRENGESAGEVALKQAKPSRRRTAGALLTRERDALLAMDHPFIPRCRGFFTEMRCEWLAADYVRGRTLENLIFEDGRIFDEADCLRWALELFDRIAHVHSRGYVHLDIRIPNVIMNEDGLHLIDFGLARRIGEHEATDPEGSPLPSRMPARVVSDLEDAAHLLLYMLYSGYTPPVGPSEPKSAASAGSAAKRRAFGAHRAAGLTSDRSGSRAEPVAGSSWENELALSAPTAALLRRLLRLDAPFADAAEASEAIRSSLNVLERAKAGN
ncbi:protein kinase [Saccharibacillus sp. O23]|uniref:serine/threonine protein kinase n=1 Tax=Saccharibacillus sp. O23 TaxID=2009338 RepID=UPI0015C616AA|nr:protein kinase [Saccharibacillus sp. O23]